MKRILSAAALAALVVTLAGPLAAAPGAVSVRIRDFAFVPAVVTIAPGTTVTWTNSDDDPHALVATDHSFRSAALDTDDLGVPADASELVASSIS